MSSSTAPVVTPTFSLTPRQIAVRDDVLVPFDQSLIYGGARSTKTFLICYAIATRALKAATSRHLVSRLHHIDVRTAVMLDTWPKMMRLAYPEVRYSTNKSDQFVILPNESEVWFGGLDDDDRVEKILGKEYATIYVNEASQVSYQTMVTLRTRLAQNVSQVDGRPLRLKEYIDLNPVGQGHWTYKEFILGLDPVTGRKIEGGSRGHAVMNPADNPHLPAQTLAVYAALPERQRKRFYEGKYLSEVPGALWPLDRIEALRVDSAPQLTRIVVAVDPSGSDGTGGDSQGIGAVGLGVDGDAYVLVDRSCRRSPAGWARQTVDTYHEYGADLVVAEANYGGAMVESTIKTADANVPVKLVSASRGKHIRAEPVAALYEEIKAPDGTVIRRGRVHHVGSFPELEEQMGMFTTAGYQGSGSPDRVDWLVWALTELMLTDNAQGWIDYYAKIAGAQPGVVPQTKPQITASDTKPEAPKAVAEVAMIAPPRVRSLKAPSGREYAAGPDGELTVNLEDADALQRAGCRYAD